MATMAMVIALKSAMATNGFGHSTFLHYVLFTQARVSVQTIFMFKLSIICLVNCFNYERSALNSLPLDSTMAPPL